MHLGDIILAVASPPGPSLRGMVRGSGSGAFELVGHMAIGDPVASQRAALPVRLRLSEGFELPALLLTYPGPKSYTGEDLFELLLPGHPGLLERVINTLIGASEESNHHARRAEAGEFTARAYLNGRLSLTEAEGVDAVIRARSDAELNAAHLLTSGALGAMATSLANNLAAALALVEAGIDFTDQEDVVAITPTELLKRLTQLEQSIDGHLERSVGFEELQAIPWVVLAGPPNAGKSTLFNALLGHDRAVVSGISGTTRDVLAEPLHLNVDGHDAEVMLIDMAGLDAADDTELNRAMQHAARDALARAELIIECHEADEPTTRPPGDHAGMPLVPEHPGNTRATRIAVQTKGDRLSHGNTQHDAATEADTGQRVLYVSAHTGAGLNELQRAIAERLADRAVSLAADALALQPRHETALRSAHGAIDHAVNLVQHDVKTNARHFTHPELIAAAMRTALDELGLLAGDISPDDVLGRIFAGFCVGK